VNKTGQWLSLKKVRCFFRDLGGDGMKKGLIIISSVLLGLSSSLFFFGCCKKDTISNLSIREVNQQSATNVADKPRIDFSRMPLSFIANKGQVDEKAKYYAKTSRFTLWLTGEGLVFDQASLLKKERIDGGGTEGENPRRDFSTLVFVNANPEPAMIAVAETGHRVNYFIGNDPAEWHSNIPTSQAVLYKDLYQGIDLKVYGVEKQIEYDWIVKPGVDPGAIRFAYQGVKGSSLDAAGNLLIETTGGELIHNRPLTYQDIDGERVSVQAEYKQTGEDTYGFIVGEYDKNHQLIIDPLVLLYSTYLGGGGTDYGYDIAADKSGNVYVTGTTDSSNFPFKNPYQTDPSYYDFDAFVTKIDTTRSGPTSLVYSTYLGGRDNDYGKGIAADDSGNAYVTGETASSDFPIRNSYQTYKGNQDAFVTRMDTTRTGAASLVYSTYLGGGDNDISSGIALDNSGNVYVAGETWSTNFPTQNPYQNDQGFLDAFVAKLSFSLPRILNTEQWELILDKGQGRTSLTLFKKDDGTITADGNWEYSYLGSNNFGTFIGAQVTISGKSIVLTATGTATNPTAPPGYTTSLYTGVFSGTVFDGQGSGTFTVSFQAYGWPDKFSGNWQGTRTSGSGITPVRTRALPWLMLLLGD
jgi:hypothetical protein